jgi:hypothetical protein
MQPSPVRAPTRSPLWLVTFIWTALAAIALAGAWAIRDAARAPAAPGALAARLAALQPLLPGAVLDIPAGSGIWLLRPAGAQVVALRAEPAGFAQRIDLCAQRTHPLEADSTLYPMTVVGTLEPTARATDTARNPLVVGPRDAAGMPAISLRGRGQDLQLRVRDPAADRGAPPRWEVASGDAADSRRGAYAFAQSAWVLWKADAGPTAAAPADSPRRHDRAIRLRRLADPACAAGVIEWQLFRAAPAQTARGDDEAAVWVVSPAGTAGANDAPPSVRLPAGTHPVPREPRRPGEDRALFERALAQHVIGDTELGVLTVATDRSDPATAQTVRDLNDSAAGHFVRGEIARYNASLHWTAVRARATDPLAQAWLDSAGHWRAYTPFESLVVTRGLPDVAVRLFSAPAPAWLDWLRVAAPVVVPDGHAHPPPAELVLSLTGAPQAVREEIELQVLGRLIRVEGAAVKSSRADCDGQGCAAPDVIQRVRLTPRSAAAQVRLTLAPENRFRALNPAGAERLRVQRRAGRPVWLDPEPEAQPAPPPSAVILTARDGTVLYADDAPTAAAARVDLTGLVGLGAGSGTGVAGTLARSGAAHDGRIEARLSIDPAWQTAAAAILACVGAREGTWNLDSARCDGAREARTIDPRRRAAFTLIDADSGDILAAASGKPVPAQVPVRELLALDRYNAAASPLRIPAWQHDGGVTHAPGSTFKIVTALALEQQALQTSGLAAQLDGLPAAQWDKLAAPSGGAFLMASPCYPAPCEGRQPKVRNYRDGRALDAVEAGRLGVVQGMRKSLNTWFAFMSERIDHTVPADADALPLGGDALHAERPLLAVAHALGFEQPMPLDGGLLGADFAWRAGDPLRAMPSRFDPIHDPHGVRQMAIGLRMQVTPLQMASVTAAVATGRRVPPRLLLQLNERAAAVPEAQPLSMPLQRVRAGMKEVVATGTARSAFGAASLASLRDGLFAKTGTAPIAGTELNSAWFVGYLRGGTLPGEPRTLAFAVSISHTDKTGGAHAAAVMAALLEARLAATGPR